MRCAWLVTQEAVGSDDATQHGSCSEWGLLVDGCKTRYEDSLFPRPQPTSKFPGPHCCNLLRRAKGIFSHIKEALEAADAFRSGVGGEYATLLQKQLLTNAAYCQRSTPAVFEGTYLLIQHATAYLIQPLLLQWDRPA